MGQDKRNLLEVLKEEKEMQLKGGIYHLTQIKFSYNTNHMEGSKLSEEQTRYIYETNTLASEGEEATSIDDIMETVNHFRCFDYMLEHAEEPLSEDLIKTFHRILKGNTSDSRKAWFNVGDYKLRPNVVGGGKTTPPSKVQSEIGALLKSYLSKEEVDFEDIIAFHHTFEKIHPFQDGNGRVGRLIMFKECLKHNIVPFIIEETHKMFYYRGLKEFDHEKGYLMDTCLSAQDQYEQMIKYFTEV